MHAAQYIAKYAHSNSPKFAGIKKERINSTRKYAEYACDIVKMTELLKTASFNEKCALAAAMQVAERKKAWHYRQDNFCLRTASILISAFKRAA